MAGTSSLVDINPRLQRIAELSRTIRGGALTTLAHHVDADFMAEAYRRTRKGGAVGIDGQSAADFAENLEGNLASLATAMHTGRYRAPPVRRVYIPKADGKQRPLGIPTFADKVLQQAVSMLLTAVYEPHFHPNSFGFRPGRSAHQALDVLRKGLMEMRGGWVIDADIRGYFDNLEHAGLRTVLEQRMRDGVILRMIGKWLNAGVMEDGALRATDSGTPQGGVISPILANIYLDEVLDRWFEEVVRPRLRGRAFLVRYADDFVLAFEHEDDARRVMDVLPKRFARFGLTLHPDKTRLLDFRHPWRKRRSQGEPSPDEPRSFDLLGFRHFWKRTKNGGFAIITRTASSRLSRAVQSIQKWCKENRHLSIGEQYKELLAKLRGHYGYYNRSGNNSAVTVFRFRLLGAWRQWLNRRSQRARVWWYRFSAILARFPFPYPPIEKQVA